MDNMKQTKEKELYDKERRISHWEKNREILDLTKNNDHKIMLGDFYHWFKDGKGNINILENGASPFSI